VGVLDQDTGKIKTLSKIGTGLTDEQFREIKKLGWYIKVIFWHSLIAKTRVIFAKCASLIRAFLLENKKID